MNEGLLANWVQLVTACTIRAKAGGSQQTGAQWGRPTAAVPPPYPLDLLLCQTASACLKALYYEWADFPLNKAYMSMPLCSLLSLIKEPVHVASSNS